MIFFFHGGLKLNVAFIFFFCWCFLSSFFFNTKSCFLLLNFSGLEYSWQRAEKLSLEFSTPRCSSERFMLHSCKQQISCT